LSQTEFDTPSRPRSWRTAARRIALTSAGLSEQAATLVAQDELTDEEIAKRLGIDRRNLTRWKDSPVFQESVAELIEQFRLATSTLAIADKQQRVAALNDRWQRMQQVITERASFYGDGRVPDQKRKLRLRPHGWSGWDKELVPGCLCIRCARSAPVTTNFISNPFSSMLQDVRMGRETEIDALSGAGSAVADGLGVAAPLNRAVADLVRVLHPRVTATGWSFKATRDGPTSSPIVQVFTN
jgi:hypothetical protein